MGATRVLLVRHGQSEWNAVGRWQGQADPPLSDVGRAQARSAARALGALDAVFASDLQRATETATIIAAELGVGPVVVDPDLRERDAGEWSGLTRAEIEEHYPGYLGSTPSFAAGAERRPPGWEPDDSVLERALRALGTIGEAAGGGDVLAVTHGGLIYVVEGHLGQDRIERLANGAGRWVVVDGDRLTLGRSRAPRRRPRSAHHGPQGDLMRVEVVRSKRRKRTAEARLIGDDHVRVSLPSWVRPEDEHEWVQPLVEKVTRRHRSAGVDLTARAAALARRYRLPVPTSIRWVGNQGSRWGSCTPATGEVRISDRLADAPHYVLDYVVVHELAHLVHGDHSPAFKELEDRYPRAERARGYLDAMSRYSANSV